MKVGFLYDEYHVGIYTTDTSVPDLPDDLDRKMRKALKAAAKWVLATSVPPKDRRTFKVKVGV
jgi:hypothetical protein